MNGTKWYADNSAKLAHEVMSAALADFVAKVFPGYELSHSGFNRNDMTEEVVIRLHLNPIGSVRVVPNIIKELPCGR